MKNSEIVQEIYSAFGRGDIATILAQLDENVEWDHGISDTGVPWLQPRTGRSGVTGFFDALSALNFKKFQPKLLLAAGNWVIAFIDVAFIVKVTGKIVSEDDEIHIWEFNDAGQVTKFRHKTDTHQHFLAFKSDT